MPDNNVNPVPPLPNEPGYKEPIEPTYTIQDNEIVDDSGEKVVTRQQLDEGGYKIENGKLLDKDNKEVEFNQSFFDLFKTTEPSTVEFEGKNYKVDEKGDLFNEDGTLFLTKEEFESKKDTSKTDKKIVVTDNDGNELELTIDSDGNAVNDDGEVMFTKDELEKQQADTDEFFKVSDLIQKTNIPVLDSEGNEVEFEDDEDGMANYVLSVAEQSLNRGKQEAFEEHFQKYPDLQRVLNHLTINGSLEGFDANATDYTKIDLSKDNKEQHKSVIIQGQMARGYTKEQAERTATWAIADEKGYEVAKEELEYLVNKQKEGDEAYEQSLKDQRNAERDSAIQTWGVEYDKKGKLIDHNIENSVYDKVIKRKEIEVDGEKLKLPDNITVKDQNGKKITRKLNDFFSYLSVPVKFVIDGKPVHMTYDQVQRQINNQKKTNDDYIYESFLNFVGGDKSQIIKQQRQQERVNEIKKIKVDSIEKLQKRSNRQGKKESNKVTPIPKLPFEK